LSIGGAAVSGNLIAAFHPVNYGLWYEHANGINPSLSPRPEVRGANSTRVDRVAFLDSLPAKLRPVVLGILVCA
jgi:hypothetical protein